MTYLESQDNDLIIKAALFTHDVYKQRFRKGDNEPAFLHPYRVSSYLERAGATAIVRIAGFLHDTVEDNIATYRVIENNFGVEVAKIVLDVTEQDKSLSWRIRKEITIDHVASMSEGSLLVKTADRIDNLSSLLTGLLEKESDFMKHFNAPLSDQIEMSGKLVVALRSKWPENPLLPDLQKTLYVISSYPVNLNL